MINLVIMAPGPSCRGVPHNAANLTSSPCRIARACGVRCVTGRGVREGQEFSTPGLVLAVLAIPVMWWLAKGKMRVADQIGSRALRADAVESITCGYLSGVVVIGLVAQLLIPGWWWIDSVTSLAI